METTDMATGKANEDVYAIGDVALLKDYIDGTTTHIALAGPANRQARLVADVINGLPYTYKGAIGTSVLKVFSLTGASTGYSEALCQRKNLPYQSVIIERNQHAGYYPGASIMTLKVVFNPKDGSLWGAQAIGLDGIEKRIDVIATALKAKMTVGDLSELELSYAPPYGSAKDVVNIAGYAAANLMEGQFKQISLDALDKEKEGAFLVDARTPLEYSLEHFDGAVNIPFVTLRKNLDKLPKDKNKKILVYCNVGMNAYLWIRIAVNLGYTNVYNIEGGMRLYKALHENVAEAVVAKEEKPMPEKNEQKVIEIDATGLQCPGPIMEASKASERLQKGDRMKIIASDCGFTSDIALWAKSTGNTLVSSENKDGKIIAVVEKGQNVASLPNVSSQSSGKTTIVLFSGDMDKALAAMIIAQGTRAMGKEATVFCTFWGLNLLRKSKAPHVKKSFIERMFGWMMPKGARKFKLSKMNMGGMGSSMMRGVMRKKNVPALEQQLASAQKAGVRFLACTMSMDIMGIKKEELIDGIDYVGVATYLSESENAGVTLFI
jgi:peroxiredoxin family protein/rhodanese-related sulfurtransferase/TusA-related sulfurtransferase